MPLKDAFQTETPGIQYTRQDGTVEHAANREEAIKMCPVLGDLALNDPEATNVLLELAEIGQAKMAEQEKPAEPEPQTPTKQAEKIEKPDSVIEPEAVVNQFQEKPVAEETIEAEPTPSPEEPVLRSYDEIAIAAHITQEQARQEVVEVFDESFAEIPAVPDRPTKRAEVREQTVRNEAPEITVLPLEIADQEPPEEILEPEPIEQVAPVEMLDALPSTPLDVVVEQSAVQEIYTLPQVVHEEQPTIEPAEFVTIEEIPTEAKPLITEVEVINKPAEAVHWAEELEKEPLQIYEDFTEALQELIVSPAEQIDFPAEEVENESVEAQETPLPLPDIAIKVSERMVELEAEEKEIVAPVLANIVESLHTIELTETHVAEPKEIESLQIELSVRVAELFERIEVEYTQEDVERFVSVLLREDLRLKRVAAEIEPTVDLEHNGTREAKIHLTSVASLIADVERGIAHLLGALVLLRATAPQLP